MGRQTTNGLLTKGYFMTIPDLQYGDFFGNIPCVRWGMGNKKMILFPVPTFSTLFIA